MDDLFNPGAQGQFSVKCIFQNFDAEKTKGGAFGLPLFYVHRSRMSIVLFVMLILIVPRSKFVRWQFVRASAQAEAVFFGELRVDRRQLRKTF